MLLLVFATAVLSTAVLDVYLLHHSKHDLSCHRLSVIIGFGEIVLHFSL